MDKWLQFVAENIASRYKEWLDTINEYYPEYHNVDSMKELLHKVNECVIKDINTLLADQCKSEYKQTQHKKALRLHRMDEAMTLLSDEELACIETWKMLHVPDRASVEYIEELLESSPTMYEDACECFANAMSNIIVNGEYNDNGYCLEFFNPEKMSVSSKEATSEKAE